MTSSDRLEPEARRLLALLEARDGQLARTTVPMERRRIFDAFRHRTDPPRRDVAAVSAIEIASDAGSIPARLYHPLATGTAPCLVWFHGGGHVAGDLETHDALCRVIANRSGCAVLNVDYRLAPEHPFPAAFDDATAAVRWAGAAAPGHRLRTDRLAVGGSSAGGNLAAAAAVHTAWFGGPRLRCQLLVYPAADATLGSDTYRRFASGFSFTTEKRRLSRDLYVGAHRDLTDPRLSPIFSDALSRLPPTLMITAELDPLRGEGEPYAAKLRQAGVSVDHVRYNGVMHGFFSQSGFLQTGRAAVAFLADTLKQFTLSDGLPPTEGGTTCGVAEAGED